MSDRQIPDLKWQLPMGQEAGNLAHTEQLRVAINHVSYVLFGNLAASTTLTIGAWERVPQAGLLTWFFVMVAFNGLRWSLGQRFPAGEMSEAARRTWDRRYMGSALVSGLLWGFAGGYFFVPGESGHNFFLALLVISMAAAAATSLSYHRIAYPLFFLPAVAPITYCLLAENGTAERAVGFVIPFYFLPMFLLSQHIFRAAHASTLSRIEHQRLAYNDHLTGMANRRSFEEVLKKEWLLALRIQHPIALIVFDVDDFKRCNDTYGHATGDDVLRAVAEMIEGRVRRGVDVAARIGGEEFAVILPETSMADAQAVAEQLCRQAHSLRSESTEHFPSPTLSAGVSGCTPRETLTLDMLVHAADSALYRAKERGKDRVELSPLTDGGTSSLRRATGSGGGNRVRQSGRGAPHTSATPR